MNRLSMWSLALVLLATACNSSAHSVPKPGTVPPRGPCIFPSTAGLRTLAKQSSAIVYGTSGATRVDEGGANQILETDFKVESIVGKGASSLKSQVLKIIYGRGNPDSPLLLEPGDTYTLFVRQIDPQNTPEAYSVTSGTLGRFFDEQGRTYLRCYGGKAASGIGQGQATEDFKESVRAAAST
jgi:hypothetical protein